MVNEYILTSSEFAKLLDITTESLRSRRRRGMYEGQYLLKNKSYLWKRPRHFKGAPTVFDRSSMRRVPSSARRGPSFSSPVASNSNHETRTPKQGARDKNNGNHRAGITKNYPNRFFELANEIKMLAKLKYKVGDEIAEDIPKALELVKQKRREELLKKCEPIKTNNFVYGRGIYDARNEPIPNKRIRWPDEIEDDERAFWSNKYY